MHEYSILEKGKPLQIAEKAIILLHGRGADAEDIISLADEFHNENFYVAAPRATGKSWYPHTFLAPEEDNEPWLSSAVEVVKHLIDDISLYISREKIFIMGFSQGACLSLEFAGRNAARYAGIAAFTGGLPGKKVREEKYAGDFEGTKIFIGNSDYDPHVPVERCEESKEILQKLGAEVTLKIYPGMPHTIILDEIISVKKLMF